jgi:hypothetical protein
VHLSRSDCNCGSCSCSMLPGEEKIVVISGLKDLLYYCNRLEIPDVIKKPKLVEKRIKIGNFFSLHP